MRFFGFSSLNTMTIFRGRRIVKWLGGQQYTHVSKTSDFLKKGQWARQKVALPSDSADVACVRGDHSGRTSNLAFADNLGPLGKRSVVGFPGLLFTMTYGAAVGLLTLLVVYSIYRRLSRISIADVPGPTSDSFILGMHTKFMAENNVNRAFFLM